MKNYLNRSNFLAFLSSFVTKLVSFAGGSYDETANIIVEIAVKNNRDPKAILQEGTKLLIMNPELGKLKAELNEAEELFEQSLQNNFKAY